MKIELETKFEVGDSVYLFTDSLLANDKSEMPVFKAEVEEIQITGIEVKKSGEIKSSVSYWLTVLDDELYEKRINSRRPLRKFENEIFHTAEEALEGAKSNLLKTLRKRSETSELLEEALNKISETQQKLVNSN